MNGKVQLDGSLSGPFDIYIGVKQGCVLDPTIFMIFFLSILLNHDFGDVNEVICGQDTMGGFTTLPE